MNSIQNPVLFDTLILAIINVILILNILQLLLIIVVVVALINNGNLNYTSELFVKVIRKYQEEDNIMKSLF